MFVARITIELAEAVGRGTRYADEQAAKTTGEEQARWIAARDALRRIGLEEVTTTAPITSEAPELIWIVHQGTAGNLSRVRREFEERFPFATVADAMMPEPNKQRVQYAVPAGFTCTRVDTITTDSVA